MRLSACVLLIAVVSGCSSGSFVGKRFDNFTAYYNTFYNAEKSFDAGTKALESGDRRVDRSTYLRVVDLPAGGAGGRDFENAIKKSADVLRDHPDSKWVDDALMLIGKSYYYTSNTVGAEQKFREVIQRESDLEDEARFWLGLTLMSSGALNEAGTHLRESIEQEDIERKWRGRMQAVLGELYVRQKRWDEAAEALRQAAGEMDDKQLGSRAQFLLGQVYETLGNYQEAAQAFRDVRRFNPLYELSYASRHNAIRVEGVYGDAEVALNDLRKMERDDKHFQYRAELRYLRGLILQEGGYASDAVAEYTRLLYDADANVATVRGPIHYQLGVIYRDMLADFSRAAAHFDTASTALRAARPSRAGSGQMDALGDAPGAIRDAPQQAEVFGSYAEIHAEVARLDSLLYLGSLDEEAFLVRIQEIRRQRATELVAERERQKSLAVQEQFGRNTGFEAAGRSPAAAANTPTGSAGFLFHRERSRVQENLLSFFDRWGERPLVVNWRRIASVSGSAERNPVATVDGSQASTDLLIADGNSVTEEALLASVDVDLSAIPRTPERIVAMETERATARYELANVLFLSIEMPDSAAAWYRTVVEENPDLPVASRALYAIAEVQRTLGDVESANAIYRRVLDEYPDSEVAERAAERIGAKIKDALPREERDPELDYESAYGNWKSGEYELAAADMLTVATRYRGEKIAARALLATGAIFVDWSEDVGTDVLAPVSMNVPDSLWIAAGVVEPLPSDAPPPRGDSVGASAVNSLPLADSSGVAASSVEAALEDSSVTSLSDSSDTATPALPDSEPKPAARPDDDLMVFDGEAVTEARQDSSIYAKPDSATGATADRLVDPPAVMPEDSLATSEEVRSGASNEQYSLEHRPIYLVDIYSLIEKEYPETEYARVARGLRQALADRKREREVAAAEAAAVAAADSSLSIDTGNAVSTDSLMSGELSAGLPPDSAAAGTLKSQRTLEQFAAADSVKGGPRRLQREDQISNTPDERRTELLRAEIDAVDSDPRLSPDSVEARPPPAAIAEDVDTKPVIVGGPNSLQRMVRYPVEAREAGITGHVLVSFVVDERGQVSDVQVEDGLGAGCDEEAMRVMRLVRYRPAMKSGRPVRYRMQERLAFSTTPEDP